MPTNGDRANPDWIHCCFSCELRSVQERVLCKKLVKRFRNSCTTFSEAEESSESYSESGKRLQRRVHSLQLKIEGCAELKTTTSPALSSECGSHSLLPPFPSVSPPFTSFSHPSPACSFASFRQQGSVGPLGPRLFLVDLPWLPSLASPLLFASTQSVIPAHSVYCVFSFPLSCLCADWAQSVIPAHSVPCCLCICFHFSFLCFSTTA